MQFSVPQFTEVEDKIIGPLTIKQFGIIFGGGVFVFIAFTLTKSMAVLIISGLFFGLPTLGLAFGKLNGRPIYNMLGNLLAFITSPKVLIFHKQGVLASDNKQKDEALGAKTAADVNMSTAATSRQRLTEVNKLLEKQAAEERELLK